MAEDVPPSPSMIKEASSLAWLHTLLEKMAREKFALPGSECSTITESGEAGDHELPEAALKTDSEFDKSAENALLKLQSINQLLNQLQCEKTENPVSLVDSKEVEKVLRQLTEKEVYLCVLGRYNVGKTTLINALLYADILPTSRDAETAVTVYIQHDRKLEGHNVWIESSSDLKGPCLTTLHASDEDAVYGMQKIKNHLEEVHSVVRRGELTKTDYRLKTSIPVFATLPKDCVITPNLVDTAGSNEAGQTELQHTALVNRRTAAVYIYVMSYSQLRNEQDYEAFRDIFQRDKSIFEDGRMMIVITHFDMSYNQDGKELTEQEVKTTVISQISRVVPEVTVSKEIIVLVSGLWAYQARVCKGTDGRSMAKSCRRSLVLLQDPDEVTSISKLSTASMCTELEDASGITVLETRLRDMVQHLFYMWKTKIIVSCQGMLQAAVSTLQEVIENTQKRLKEAFERSTHCRDVERLHAQLLKSIEKDSSILSTLGAKYDEDTPCFMDMMKDTIGKLMEDLESKVNKGSYTPGDLKQDVDTTFREDVEMKMTNLFKQTKFNTCHGYLRRQLADYADKFGRLKASAILLYEHEHVRTTISNEDEEAADTIDEIVEQTNKKLEELDIPEVTYGLKEKIKVLFDWLFLGMLKVRIIRQEDLQSVKDSITASLQKHQRKFFKEIREPVILYFFKIFCQRITKDLSTFHNLVKVHNWTIVESLNTMQKEQHQMERIVSQCEEWRSQLRQLKDQVEVHSGHNDSYKNV